jgi:hypothetical protein
MWTMRPFRAARHHLAADHFRAQEEVDREHALPTLGRVAEAHRTACAAVAAFLDSALGQHASFLIPSLQLIIGNPTWKIPKILDRVVNAEGQGDALQPPATNLNGSASRQPG